MLQQSLSKRRCMFRSYERLHLHVFTRIYRYTLFHKWDNFQFLSIWTALAYLPNSLDHFVVMAEAKFENKILTLGKCYWIYLFHRSWTQILYDEIVGSCFESLLCLFRCRSYKFVFINERGCILELYVSWNLIVVSRLTWAFISDCRFMYLGARVAEYQGCKWGMQIIDGSSLELYVATLSVASSGITPHK